ncbi:MAG: alpha/beta hydrolase [Burkholderiales bacterium]
MPSRRPALAGTDRFKDSHGMRTQLISIPTDTTPLDGAFHEPDGAATAGAVLLFHGNTMNFYIGALRFLPPVLTRLGLACLAFNRRGHDILSIRNSRTAEGAAFQLTHEAIADNEIAAQWLAARGFPNPVVIGHSNGGVLGVRHVANHLQTPALVVLSATRGGTGSARSSGGEGLFAGDRLDELTARARALVEAGHGRDLMFLPGWWHVISAESFLDRLTEVPDTIALAPRIKCPVLYLRGGNEIPERFPGEELCRHIGGPCQVEVVPDCDHFYNGCEPLVADIVASWLTETLGLPRAT